MSFVYLVVQIYGVGLITSHLTGFSFELGIFVGLGGVLVCSFLGGMRAVTWTQVAQYLVLIMAYLVPLTWLSIKQTGHPLAGVVLQRATGAQRGARSAAGAIRPNSTWRGACAQWPPTPTASSRTCAAPWPSTRRRVAAHCSAACRQCAADADPACRARTGAAPAHRSPGAPATCAKETWRWRARSRWPACRRRPCPLRWPIPSGTLGRRGRFDAARINFIALMLCLMLGTAAMPHVLTRYYTTPSVAQARRSVAWSLLFITLLYMSAPTLAVLVKFEVLNHVVGLPLTSCRSG